MNLKAPDAAVFNTTHLINLKGSLMDLSKPKVMGIINVTPDSFYDGGKYTEMGPIIKQVRNMLRDGADIIDIGGQSTRPNAKMVSAKTELKRVLPVVESILEKFPKTILSIDTWYSEVAGRCIERGAAMVNDVSAGRIDKNMYKTVGKLRVPYVLMHMKGTPKTMQLAPRYRDVSQEVVSFLIKEISKLRAAGVVDIVVDPGFGFGKTVTHNFELLNKLERLKLTGCPLLAGVSRKSMIYKTLNTSAKNALNGTTALNMVALIKGARILRVHDVKEAKEVCQLFEQLENQGT
jgi:dihydropteroate synthase